MDRFVHAPLFQEDARVFSKWLFNRVPLDEISVLPSPENALGRKSKKEYQRLLDCILPYDLKSRIRHPKKRGTPTSSIPTNAPSWLAQCIQPVYKLDAPMVNNYYFHLLDCNIPRVLMLGSNSKVYHRKWNGALVLQGFGPEVGPSVSCVCSRGSGEVFVGWDTGKKGFCDFERMWNSSINDSYPYGFTLDISVTTREAVYVARWASEHVLYMGGSKGGITRCDTRTSCVDHLVPPRALPGFQVAGLAYNSDRAWLAAGNNDNRVRVYDERRWLTPRDDPLFTNSTHTACVRGLAWSPLNSSLLASGGGAGDRTVRMWNVGTGACVGSVDVGAQVTDLKWREDELFVSLGFASGDHACADVMVVNALQPVATIGQHNHPYDRTLHMELSADQTHQTHLCTVNTGDEQLNVWNIERVRLPPPVSNSSLSLPCIR